MVIVSPSVKCLKILLSIGQQYARSHDVLYNATKSKVMMKVGRLKLNCQCLLNFVRCLSGHCTHVYLGYVIIPNLTDDRDIARSKRAICITANMLSIVLFLGD